MKTTINKETIESVKVYKSINPFTKNKYILEIRTISGDIHNILYTEEEKANKNYESISKSLNRIEF